MTIEQVSPGLGNHAVHGRAPKSYPLVAGENISICTRVDAEGNKRDLLVAAPSVTTLQGSVADLLTRVVTLEKCRR